MSPTIQVPKLAKDFYVFLKDESVHQQCWCYLGLVRNAEARSHPGQVNQNLHFNKIFDHLDAQETVRSTAPPFQHSHLFVS